MLHLPASTQPARQHSNSACQGLTACWCCHCRLQALECLLLCISSRQGHNSELFLAALQFLRSALAAAGVTPPPSPQLNLTFLQTAADLAVGQTLVRLMC